uniref:Uncharacterized protein n=1 Tax=Candidatus Kentrum sp. MB TaxID=2138164 RepID=A0A450XLS5_9GAMM|nr:MAG: hypothetical protein BECKMB1821G_GA0114241_106013 [Candidatus Kentron sp. MB]VFK34038.1 MAG: hypothetical protein BECKMB1821I_GA0114274_105914 [Candidatus Kentron sp. MB]VFK76209.1 MAG: hypothetical protein BECKMB1821H_GA0114242_104613 [Candidatus Kentron sp. MB]
MGILHGLPQPGKPGTEKVDNEVSLFEFREFLIVLSRIFRESDEYNAIYPEVIKSLSWTSIEFSTP